MANIRPKDSPRVTVPTAADSVMLDGATLRSIAIENFVATLGVHAADVVAAATLNLDTVIGDVVDVTGNTGITAITLTDGDERTVRFTGTPTLTNGASLVLPGGSNITAAAGDFAIFRGYAAGVVRCVSFVRISGKPIVPNSASEVGAQAADAQLFSNIPQNARSANYTTVLSDGQKHIFHPLSDNNPRTFTIDSNANVAYQIGTAITFINKINTVTIAITADTLTLAGAGTTGSRTLAANGMATAIKIAATEWIINGAGLT